VGHFTRRAEELGVQVHRIPEGSDLATAVARLCEGKATYVEPALDFLRPALRERVTRLVDWDRLPEAEVGVTGADYGLAESGTLVLWARPARPRSGSLLPPVHVALLREDRILVDLFDLLQRLGACAETPSARGERRRLDVLPTGLVLATGPSRSADIEMSLAVGVHGPGTVHVVLVPGGQDWPGGLAK
jgi:L-lactate dehydrogenase complex protein LldG